MIGLAATSRLVLLVGAVLWAACGRIGFAPVPLGPFSEPAIVAALAEPEFDDDDPTVTDDLLELYFESARLDGMGDVFVSTRASPADPWGPPRVVTELSEPDRDDETPEVSGDGLTLIYARLVPGAGGDLYVTTRASRGEPWSAAVPVNELNSPEGEGAAALDASELRLVFHSSRAGGAGELDLYEANRPSTVAPWNPPRPIVELNTEFNDVTPFLVAGGLTLYFASDRPGGAGSLDLYHATRPSLDAPFGPPLPVDEFNTPAELEDPWLSPDLRYIVFTDDRTGDREIYEAWR